MGFLKYIGTNTEEWNQSVREHKKNAELAAMRSVGVFNQPLRGAPIPPKEPILLPVDAELIKSLTEIPILSTMPRYRYIRSLNAGLSENKNGHVPTIPDMIPSNKVLGGLTPPSAPIIKTSTYDDEVDFDE